MSFFSHHCPALIWTNTCLGGQLFWSRITHSFLPPQNCYLLQACFKSYYRKILSQISFPVNPTGPSLRRPYECYDRKVKREKKQSSSQNSVDAKHKVANRTVVSCANVSFSMISSCEKTFVNFLTVRRHVGVSYTVGAEIKQVPGSTQEKFQVV